MSGRVGNGRVNSVKKFAQLFTCVRFFGHFFLKKVAEHLMNRLPLEFILAKAGAGMTVGIVVLNMVY